MSSIDNEIRECYEKYYTTYSNFPLNIDGVKELIDLANKNVWFKYLCNLTNKDITWIDFEKEIEKVVRAFEHFFEKEQTEDMILGKLSILERNIIYAFDFFFSIVEDGMIINGKAKRKKVIEEYLLYNPISKNSIINKEKVISYLYNQLIELSEMLKLYLRHFIDDVVEKLSDVKLIEKHIDLSQVSDVVTLNYTHTFEKLYSKGKERHIYHIHGDVENDIILGINSNEKDEVGTINTDFLCFKKYYQRVFYKTDIEYLMALKYNDLFDSRNTNNLIVFGHSLDSTDRDIIVDLFSFSNKIKIYCYNKKAMSDNIKNLVNIYGREGFDILRSEKEMTFIVLDEI